MDALLATPARDYSPEMVSLHKPELTEEANWVARAQRADARAFESLYRMHVDRVYGLCLRMTGNVGEAEDCAQEAFIQAWKQLHRFRGDSAFSTWLHRIAVNSVLGRMRKSKREHDRIQVVADQAQSSPVTVADTGELRDLAEAVDRLPRAELDHDSGEMRLDDRAFLQPADPERAAADARLLSDYFQGF